MLCSAKRPDLVWLTSNLLYELTWLAKTNGCLLEVKAKNDMGLRFVGEFVGAYFCHEGYRDRNGHIARCNTITVSDPIDVDNFCAALRPEMNWGEIPRDQIHSFLVHHEIGHARLDPNLKNIMNASGTVDKDKTQTLMIARELRADRYAWKSLFPLQPLPRREGCEPMVESLEAFMRDHRDLFAEPRVPKPLDNRVPLPSLHS